MDVQKLLVELSDAHILCPGKGTCDAYTFDSLIGRLPNALYQHWKTSPSTIDIQRITSACLKWCNATPSEAGLYKSLVQAIVCSSYVFSQIEKSVDKTGFVAATILELRSLFAIIVALKVNGEIEISTTLYKWILMLRRRIASHPRGYQALLSYNYAIEKLGNDYDNYNIFPQTHVFESSGSGDNKLREWWEWMKTNATIDVMDEDVFVAALMPSQIPKRFLENRDLAIMLIRNYEIFSVADAKDEDNIELIKTVLDGENQPDLDDNEREFLEHFCSDASVKYTLDEFQSLKKRTTEEESEQQTKKPKQAPTTRTNNILDIYNQFPNAQTEEWQGGNKLSETFELHHLPWLTAYLKQTNISDYLTFLIKGTATESSLLTEVANNHKLLAHYPATETRYLNVLSQRFGASADLSNIQERFPWELLQRYDIATTTPIQPKFPSPHVFAEALARRWTMDVCKWDIKTLKLHYENKKFKDTEEALIFFDLHPCYNDTVWHTRSDLNVEQKWDVIARTEDVTPNDLQIILKSDTLPASKYPYIPQIYWHHFISPQYGEQFIAASIARNLLPLKSQTWRYETALHILCNSFVVALNPDLFKMLAGLMKATRRRDYIDGVRRHASYLQLINNKIRQVDESDDSLLLSPAEILLLRGLALVSDDKTNAHIKTLQEYRDQVVGQLSYVDKIPNVIKFVQKNNRTRTAHIEYMEDLDLYRVREGDLYVMKN